MLRCIGGANVTTTLMFAAAALSVTLPATAADSPIPRFQSVSIKPSAGCSSDGPPPDAAIKSSPARLELRCQPLKRLIQLAYVRYSNGRWTTGFFQDPIEGGPAWIASTRFDIDASADGASRWMMLGPMMQALLEDRFQLKVHYQSREVPAYNLTVADGGPRVKVAQEGDCIRRNPGEPPPDPPLGPVCVTMADLAEQLGPFVGRLVIDKTDISGVFDVPFHVRIIEDMSPKAAFTETAAAMRSQLPGFGLKIEDGTANREIVVIDDLRALTRN
jgi:uncharacterized protein (TIGR03435 family)